ncbi:MAG: thermonuclease family protein [Pseudomonadota bacterium]
MNASSMTVITSRLQCAASFLVVILGCVTSLSAAEAAISGRILWVIDGDTYQIAHAGAPEGEAVRARHFDTPEKADRAGCLAEREKGRQATEAARRLLPRGTTVWMSDFGRDRYGRLLATITLPDGTDLATWFIDAGLAHPYEGGRKPSWCLGLDDQEEGPSVPATQGARARKRAGMGLRCETLVPPTPASRRAGRRFGRAQPPLTCSPRFYGEEEGQPHLLGGMT